jgi:hypothetical protein
MRLAWTSTCARWMRRRTVLVRQAAQPAVVGRRLPWSLCAAAARSGIEPSPMWSMRIGLIDTLSCPASRRAAANSVSGDFPRADGRPSARAGCGCVFSSGLTRGRRLEYHTGTLTATPFGECLLALSSCSRTISTCAMFQRRAGPSASFGNIAVEIGTGQHHRHASIRIAQGSRRQSNPPNGAHAARMIVPLCRLSGQSDPVVCHCSSGQAATMRASQVLPQVPLPAAGGLSSCRCWHRAMQA